MRQRKRPSQLMTHEERRKLIEAPFPINTFGSQGGRAGVGVIDYTPSGFPKRCYGSGTATGRYPTSGFSIEEV